MEQRSLTSPQLPLPWVVRLFERMTDMYGALWLDRWANIPMPRVMQTWAEDLGDLKAEEIRQGLELCREKPYPPTLPEFRLMCRPAMDMAKAYHEAVEQMVRRRDGQDRWSSPVIYWAAAKIGNDIANHTHDQMKARWAKAMEDAKAEIEAGELPAEVPQRLAALPAFGQVTVTAEDAHRRADEIRKRIGHLAATKVVR